MRHCTKSTHNVFDEIKWCEHYGMLDILLKDMRDASRVRLDVVVQEPSSQEEETAYLKATSQEEL